MAEMSKRMEEAYDLIVGKVDKARNAKCFGEWFCGSEEAYEEWLIRRTATFGEKKTKLAISRNRKVYELAKKGIVGAGDAGYNTVDALVRHGLVEHVVAYGAATLAGYPVKLV